MVFKYVCLVCGYVMFSSWDKGRFRCERCGEILKLDVAGGTGLDVRNGRPGAGALGSREGGTYQSDAGG